LEASDESKASTFKLYEKGYTKFLKTVMNPPPLYAPLQWVAQQTEYCLLAKFPPAKRAVGIDAHLISALSWIVPDSVLDLVVGLIL
jgi:spore germination protein YaaH